MRFFTGAAKAPHHPLLRVMTAVSKSQARNAEKFIQIVCAALSARSPRPLIGVERIVVSIGFGRHRQLLGGL
jgi:hypothetical protein